MDVSTPSARHSELEQKRVLCRTLMGGSKAIRDAGTTLTPQHPAEDDEVYKIRLEHATLYDGYSSTVKKQAGKIFSKKIILNDDMPEQMKAYCDDIDGQGRNLTTFGYDAFINAFIDGVSFVYSDYPVIEQKEGVQLTQLDIKNIGIRPTAILVTASQLIKIDSISIGGSHRLTMARIKEAVTDESGATVDQIRELTIGAWEIFRQDTKGNWVSFDNGATKLTYIPLVPLYTNRVGFFEGEPSMQGLAELNLAHWISSTEQCRALTMARFAMMVFSGVADDDKIGKVGADVVFKLADPASKWGTISTSGSGIEQGRLDILGIEKRMESAGMTVRVETSQGTTATAAKINSADGDAALMAMAEVTEGFINNFLAMMGAYVDKAGGTVNINANLASTIPEGSSEDISKLSAMGLISNQLALQELKRRNILSPDLNIEEELGRITEQHI